MTDGNVRERRWVLLAETGDDEVGAAEVSLRRAGVGRFLAVSEGDYWSRGPISLLEVRRLNSPVASWDAALATFLTKCHMTVESAS